MDTPTTTHRPDASTASKTVVSTAATNLYTRLNIDWLNMCQRPSHDAEVLTWAASQPALADVTGLDDLARAHRADRDGVLLALLTLHQDGSGLAGRALLQLMLGKLIQLTRHARVSGYDRNIACDDRAATTVAAFMSLVAHYRPTGTNVYAALFLHTLKQIAKVDTFAAEVPAGHHDDFVVDTTPEHDSGPSALALLDSAVERGVITVTDRLLLQRAYLDETDIDLAAVAADADVTPAALRQRLSRAMGRLRKDVVVSHRRSTVPPRYARKPLARARDLTSVTR